jgi:hypothetical protein
MFSAGRAHRARTGIPHLSARCLSRWCVQQKRIWENSQNHAKGKSSTSSEEQDCLASTKLLSRAHTEASKPHKELGKIDNTEDKPRDKLTQLGTTEDLELQQKLEKLAGLDYLLHTPGKTPEPFPKQLYASAFIQNIARHLGSGSDVSKTHKKLTRWVTKFTRGDIRNGRTWTKVGGDVEHTMLWTQLPDKYTRKLMEARIQCLDLIVTRYLWSVITSERPPGYEDTLREFLRIVDGSMDDDEARKQKQMLILSPSRKLTSCNTSPLIRTALNFTLAAEVLSLELRVRKVVLAGDVLETVVKKSLRTLKQQRNRIAREAKLTLKE